MLKVLVSSVIDYIKTFFYEYDKDPEMHLSCSLEGLMTIKKLEIITHWMERIAFHTDRFNVFVHLVIAFDHLFLTIERLGVNSSVETDEPSPSVNDDV